jgi:hypothetical protein
LITVADRAQQQAQQPPERRREARAAAAAAAAAFPPSGQSTRARAAAAMADRDTSSSGEDDRAEWEDWEGASGDEQEEGEPEVKSLFDDALLPSAEAAFEHDAAHSGFDIRRYRVEVRPPRSRPRQRRGAAAHSEGPSLPVSPPRRSPPPPPIAPPPQKRLDEYDTLRCINYIRTEVAAGRDPRPALAAVAPGGAAAAPWAPTPAGDEPYLRPALEDDGLLFYDFDEEAAEEGAGQGAGGEGGSVGGDTLRRLVDENAALREALASLALASMPEELRAELEAGGAGARCRRAGRTAVYGRP